MEKQQEQQKKTIVAVTGGTGYIACEVIYQLLEKGYIVRATVRNPERAQDLVKAFTINNSLNPNLTLFTADLLKDGSFDECFKGVNFVMHTASPFQLVVNDPQKDLVDPALNGTLNVLSSVEKNLDTIKRVVITSSVAAIVQQVSDTPDKVWTEEDWNTTSSLTAGPYRYSKYLAEKAAWDWAKGKEDKVRVLAINPTFVLGRLHLNRSDSTSIKTIIGLLDGSAKEKGVSNSNVGFVNVRNVAEAHIACIENEKASGRYMVTSTRSVSQLEYVEALKKEFSQYPLPEKINGELGPDIQLSREKAEKELGIKFIDIEETILEMAHSLVRFGLVEKK